MRENILALALMALPLVWGEICYRQGKRHGRMIGYEEGKRDYVRDELERVRGLFLSRPPQQPKDN